MTEKNEVILTLEELHKTIKHYQKRLRLQDWDIDVCFVPQSCNPETNARATFRVDRKRAMISIPTPETYFRSEDYPQNMLMDVVHEMIHFHFFMCTEFQGHDKEHFELAIDRIAEALIEGE